MQYLHIYGNINELIVSWIYPVPVHISLLWIRKLLIAISSCMHVDSELCLEKITNQEAESMNIDSLYCSIHPCSFHFSAEGVHQPTDAEGHRGWKSGRTPHHRSVGSIYRIRWLGGSVIGRKIDWLIVSWCFVSHLHVYDSSMVISSSSIKSSPSS